jgi:hypothetical protein
MTKINHFFGIILLLSGLCTAPLLAQECGTPEASDEVMNQLPWVGNPNFSYNLPDSVKAILSRSTERSGACNDPLPLPIQFWIYRDSDADPNQPNERQLQALVDQVTNLFRNNGLQVNTKSSTY